MVNTLKLTTGLVLLGALTQSYPSLAGEIPQSTHQQVEQLEEIEPTNKSDWSWGAGEDNNNNNVKEDSSYEMNQDTNDAVNSNDTDSLNEWQELNVGDPPNEGGSIPVIGF